MLLLLLLCVLPSIRGESSVSCQHVQNLLDHSEPWTSTTQILQKCLERADQVGRYDYRDLYLSCNDVFGSNLTKLTTSLVKDYLRCEKDGYSGGSVNDTFHDILRVFVQGNGTISIDDKSVVSCGRNISSHKFFELCREFGLTREQRSLGFLRYLHGDRWAQEESVDELELTCDRVFSEDLQNYVYLDPVRAFVDCGRRASIEASKRDEFEKMHAVELMDLRGQNTTNFAINFRGFVNCRNLQGTLINGTTIAPNWAAKKLCLSKKGFTYAELLNEPGNDYDVEVYLECQDVFNEKLERFTGDLLEDYRLCLKADKIEADSKNFISKKFKKMFDIIGKKESARDRYRVLANLVSCIGFDSTLADVCRARGTTLIHEMLNIGDLARLQKKTWLNVEDLAKLYLRCDDLFDEWIEHLDDVPLDRFNNCRFVEGISDRALEYMDERLEIDFKHEKNNDDDDEFSFDEES